MDMVCIILIFVICIVDFGVVNDFDVVFWVLCINVIN